MAMTTEMRKGMVINYNGEPTLVMEREFYKPGKGGAYNRTKLKGLKSGKIVSNTFRSGETVEEVDIQNRNVQFSYADEDNAYFMDPTTYDLITISMDMIDGGTDFLIADGKYQAMFYEDEAISLTLPAKVTLEVTEAAQGGDRGNTSGNPLKEVTLETGLKIKVPLFINMGDKIIINTEERSYVGKENK